MARGLIYLASVIVFWHAAVSALTLAAAPMPML